MLDDKLLPLVSRNVRRLRKAAGMTQVQLEAKTGSEAIKGIESGRRTGRMKTLEIIAEACGATLADIFDDREAPPAEQLPPAFHEFLKTEEAKSLTEDEFAQLAHMKASGKRPTVTTYLLMLQSLRSMVPDSEKK